MSNFEAKDVSIPSKMFNKLKKKMKNSNNIQQTNNLNTQPTNQPTNQPVIDQIKELTNKETIPSQSVESKVDPTDKSKVSLELITYIRRFWTLLSTDWKFIHKELIETAIIHDDNSIEPHPEALAYLEGCAHQSLREALNFYITIGKINHQYIKDVTEPVIELYISPKLKRDSIPLMEEFYNKRTPLENLIVVKYQDYHPNDTLPEKFEYDDGTIVTYDDIGYQGAFGYDADRKPTLNIILTVKPHLADKLLIKKLVKFQELSGEIKERSVYMPTEYMPFEGLLINCIGEANFLNHVGYVELLPENDPLIVTGSVFTEIADMRESIKMVRKSYTYEECHYCKHTSDTLQLSRCRRCKKAQYCSVICQKANWSNHKKICQESNAITGNVADKGPAHV
jgi:hypothetical protein